MTSLPGAGNDREPPDRIERMIEAQRRSADNDFLVFFAALALMSLVAFVFVLLAVLT